MGFKLLAVFLLGAFFHVHEAVAKCTATGKDEEVCEKSLLVTKKAGEDVHAWSEDASTSSHGQDGECADFANKNVLQIPGWFKADGPANFKTEKEHECVDHMKADPQADAYTWIPSWFDQHPYNCFLRSSTAGYDAKPDFVVCSGKLLLPVVERRKTRFWPRRRL